MGSFGTVDIQTFSEKWESGGKGLHVLKKSMDLQNRFFVLLTNRFVYLYSVAATYPVHIQWINPTIIGTFLLTLLFQGSTALTEFLSSSKYPAYRQYQQTTSRFIPLFAGRPLDEFDGKVK